MIVWLASYPRSGNTLLRTVLKQTMGLDSFSDGADEEILNEIDTIGIKKIGMSWDSFYQEATTSKDVVLVKTHKPPCDNQPAIYVVRDGRASTESYAAFHKRFAPNPEFCPSVLDLKVGDDFYGDWSNHYYVWVIRSALTLFISLEDLAEAKPRLIKQISDFLEIAPLNVIWSNTMTKLRRNVTDVFRNRSTSWQTAHEWTEEIDRIFNYMHSDLMVKLGFCTKEMVDSAIADLSSNVRNVLDIAAQLSTLCTFLQFQCDESLKVIKQLSKS